MIFTTETTAIKYSFNQVAISSLNQEKIEKGD